MKKLCCCLLSLSLLLFCGCDYTEYEEPPVSSKEDTVPKVVALAAADFDGWGEATLRVFEDDANLSVVFYDKSGDIVELERLATDHAGWLAVFLYNDGEGDYILTYNPSCYQGLCHYEYTLYTITESGLKETKKTNFVNFDINGKEPLPVDSLVSFYEEINALLKKSTLLISTLDATVKTEGEYREEYDWLYSDGFGTENLYDADDTLKEKLTKYDAYMTEYYHGS